MENQLAYRVTATWEGGGKGRVSAHEISPTIHFSMPPGFHGDPGSWTPEHFLLAAVASCYMTTFHVWAEMSTLEFLGIGLLAEGKLGLPDGSLGFMEIVLKPTLTIVQSRDRELADRLLEKALQVCRIARCLVWPVHLEPLVQVAEEVLAS
jgi:organic hydroperoxide reductase OsmC/OhrA